MPLHNSINGISGGFLAMALALPFVSAHARGVQETVLYSFKGNKGPPFAGLTLGNAGNLYGTTTDTCGGAGSIFKLTPDGIETQLHNFRHQRKGGQYPTSGLLTDSSGNLYGTTILRRCGVPGHLHDSPTGTIFKLAPDETETVLHAFKNHDPAGWSSSGTPIADSVGNLYDTTVGGGANNGGTVFKLAPDGKETVLYAFERGTRAYAGLMMDGAGNLFGTTVYGGGTGCDGGGCGTVFKIAPDGTESLLHAFAGGEADGRYPEASLVADGAGNLYGTTSQGGGNQVCVVYTGCGTAFKVAPDGTETVLHFFGDGDDGATPIGNLTMDGAANLYGTATYGGSTNCTYGCGVVFELTPDGTYTVLHYFKGGMTDGANPVAGLIADSAGNLYGTTIAGGTGTDCIFGGCGTVFKITLGTRYRR